MFFNHSTHFLLTNYSFVKSVRTSTLCMTQVIFPTIVYREIISLIIHCITIPVGQKFTYTKYGNSKEISQDLRKKIVDLHKSGSSLGAISKCLKVPHSSVQTIVCKYKHHGTTQLSYCSGRRRSRSPRDEHTLV